MPSPPTSPRRRGRLQPEPYGCGLSIDGLTAKSSANLGGRPFARPPVGRFPPRRLRKNARVRMRSKQAHTAHSRLPQDDALVAWPPARKASVARETLDVEILGGVKSGWLKMMVAVGQGWE